MHPSTVFACLGVSHARSLGHKENCGNLVQSMMVAAEEGACTYWFCASVCFSALFSSSSFRSCSSSTSTSFSSALLYNFFRVASSLV